MPDERPIVERHCPYCKTPLVDEGEVYFCRNCEVEFNREYQIEKRREPLPGTFVMTLQHAEDYPNGPLAQYHITQEEGEAIKDAMATATFKYGSFLDYIKNVRR